MKIAPCNQFFLFFFGVRQNLRVHDDPLFLYRPLLTRCGSLAQFPADTICDPVICSQLVCARDHSLCRTCQMAPTAKLLKGPPVWGAGCTRSCRVCVTLAFAVVRRCGCDSMPIQSTGFGLLWKWPKHSERNPSNRKGKPSPGASRRAATAASIGRVFFRCRSDYRTKTEM